MCLLLLVSANDVAAIFIYLGARWYANATVSCLLQRLIYGQYFTYAMLSQHVFSISGLSGTGLRDRVLVQDVEPGHGVCWLKEMRGGGQCWTITLAMFLLA